VAFIASRKAGRGMCLHKLADCEVVCGVIGLGRSRAWYKAIVAMTIFLLRLVSWSALFYQIAVPSLQHHPDIVPHLVSTFVVVDRRRRASAMATSSPSHPKIHLLAARITPHANSVKT